MTEIYSFAEDRKPSDYKQPMMPRLRIRSRLYIRFSEYGLVLINPAIAKLRNSV